MVVTGVDQLRILGSLQAHGVRYVLVGELAAALHGGPLGAEGIEICLPDDQQNLARMANVLRQVSARVSADEAEDHHATFDTRYGRLDCLEDAAGFASLDATAVTVDLGDDIVARVAALEDLAGRSMDAVDPAGAVRLAALVGAAEITPEDLNRPIDAEPEARGRLGRILHKLENLDDFLTDVNNGDRALGRTRN
jgi:hypothetical protein